MTSELEPRADAPIRIAYCPHCAASTRLDLSNRWRPFCSERCKLIDLGDWLSGRFALPVETTHDDALPDPTADIPVGL